MYLICPDPHPSIFQLYQSGEVGALEASEKLQDQRSWAFKFSSLVFILRARAQLHSVLLCRDWILKNESKPQSQRLIGHWPWVSSYRSGGPPVPTTQPPRRGPMQHLPLIFHHHPSVKKGLRDTGHVVEAAALEQASLPVDLFKDNQPQPCEVKDINKINREAVRKETVHLQGTSRRKV